jgi:sulfofructose kinase
MTKRILAPVDVVGFGLNAMDTVCVVDRFPAPNTKSPIHQIRLEPGGQVATAMATCARFGLKARYIGSVGNDDLGQAQLRSLRESGLATDDVRVVDGAKTQWALILLEEGIGERTILWHHDPLLKYPVEQLQRESILSSRILHLDGCDSAAALQAARWAREAGIPVVIDIDELYDESTEELLRNVDYLLAAEEFAQGVVPNVPPDEAAQILADRFGCRLVGITLGDRGAVFVENRRVLRSHGFQVSVADTTGAGDVFHGAFIYGLLQNWPVEQIARFANAAAALECTKIGARRGIPDLEDVLKLAKPRRGERI